MSVVAKIPAAEQLCAAISSLALLDRKQEF
jgi:hypothetical protein